MPNMTTTKAISVVNSLDKDQIFRFFKHFVSSETFPFPKEYIVELLLSGEMALHILGWYIMRY